MEERLRTPRSITFKNIRRTANKLADRLANQGVNQQLLYFSGPLSDSNDEQIKNECTSLAQQDHSFPDAVDDQRINTTRMAKVGKWQLTCAICKFHCPTISLRTKALKVDLTLFHLVPILCEMALGGFPIFATSLRAFIWVLDVAGGDPSITFRILNPRSTLVHNSFFAQISSLSMSHFIHSLLDSPFMTVTHLDPLSAIISPSLNVALVQAHMSPFTMGSSLTSYQAIPSPSLCPAPFIMRRERPRMGCRRGSARGRAIFLHSATLSKPTSKASEFSSFNYPATRSGRGRGRGLDRINVCENHSHSCTIRF